MSGKKGGRGEQIHHQEVRNSFMGFFDSIKVKRLLLRAGAALFLFFPLAGAALALDEIQFPIAPGTGVTQLVNAAPVTFVAQAYDSLAPDPTFNGVVSFGFYKNSALPGSFLFADPQAEFLDSTGVTVIGTGTASVTFASGAATFLVVFHTGSDEATLVARHPSVAVANGQRGPYQIKGSQTVYYPIDANSNTIAAVYPAGVDDFTINPVAVEFPTEENTDIPYSDAVGTNSATYEITGVNGRYAFGGTDIASNLVASRRVGSSPLVLYRVILDYDGDLANYNSPQSEDTVYDSLGDNLGGSPITLVQATENTSYAPLDTNLGFVNGKVILKVWSVTPPATGVAQLRMKAPSATSSSFLTIPYSESNVSPVQAAVVPNQVLANAPATMVYTITNFSGFDLTQTQFKIPKNPGGTGTPWTLSTATTRSGGSATITNPGGSDGNVNIGWSSPVTVGEAVPVTLTFSTTSDVIQPNWDFGLLTLAPAGVDPDPNSAKNIETIGAPPASSGITAVVADINGTGGKIDLSWGPVTLQQANGYVLSRRSPAGSGGFTDFMTINSNATTTFQDTGLTNLSSYDYIVRAKNVVALSAPVASNAATAFVNPGPPTGVQALTGNNTIQLNWTAPTVTGNNFPLAGYRIYRDIDSSMASAITLTNTGAVTTYTDATASNGTRYYYQIASKDNQFTSGTPGQAHISTLLSPVTGFPPGNPPSGLGVTLTSAAAPATLTVSWGPPVDFLSAPVSYVIHRAVDTGSFAPLTVLAASATLHNNAVTVGSYYVYRVAAVDGGGVTSNFAGPVTGYVVPSAPGGVVATGLAGQIVLDWADNSPSEGVTQYRVYQYPGGSAVTTLNTSGPVSLTGFALGTNYSFEVTAFNTGGEGGPSAPVTSARLPTVPLSLTATADAVVRSNVNLTWAAPVAQPNVVSYNVLRDTDNNIAGATTIALGLPATLAYQDTGLGPVTAAGATFYYFVQAQNPGGAGPPTAGQSLVIPPNEPTGLTPTSSASAITLNWTGNNPSENVTSYRVYKQQVGSSPATLAGTVTSPAVSFNDGNVSAGVTYYYQVSALNTGGESLHNNGVTFGLKPQVPNGLGVTVSTANGVTFNWGPIVDANASSVSVWINGSAVTGVAPSPTIFIDPVLKTPNTFYAYTLSTNNPYGSGVTAAPVTILTYPAGPAFNSLSLISGGVSEIFDWTLAGGPVTAYNVYRSQNIGGPYFKVLNIPASGLTMPTTQGLAASPGQAYYYKVTAQNATGEGADSNILSLNVPPAAPTPLTAVSGLSVAVTQVDLSWPAVTGQGVVAYYVYRSPDNSSFVSIGSVSSPTTVFSETGLTGAQTYYYKVTSYNGTESVISAVPSVAVTAYSPPNQPGGLAAVAGTTQVTLNWSAAGVTNTYPIAGYNVYQSTSAGVTGAKFNPTPVPGTTLPVTGLLNGTTYYFSIQAVDTATHTGAVTGQVSEVPVIRPNPPTLPPADPGNGAVQLRWVPGSAGTLPISKYIIYRATLPGPVFAPVTQISAPTTVFNDTGLSNTTNYVYYIQAVDSTGVTTGTHISVNSNSVTVLPDVILVNPPYNVVANAGTAAVSLSWSDAWVSGSGSVVTGYTVYRAIASGGPYNIIGAPVTTGLPTPQYVDNTATPGIAYFYRLLAADDSTPTVNVSAYSAIVSGTAAGAPNAPGGLVSTDGVSQVSLAWTANTTVDNVPVSFYTLYRDIDSGGFSPVTNILSSPLTYLDTGLSIPSTIQYYLTATNRNGTTGSASTTITAYPYDLGPPGSFASTSGATAVTLTWNVPGTASYAVSAYSIYQSTVSGSYGLPMTTIAASGSPMTFVDTVPQGVINYYKIRAIDDKNHSGTLSVEIFDGAAVAPALPTTFVALAGDSQVLLDWSPSSGPNGSLPVSYYILTGPGGPVNVPPGQTWFLDAPLSNGVPAAYTLQVVDITGQISPDHVSVASSPVSATPDITNVNPPTGVTASATGNTIHLSWTPADGRGRVIAYYVITRSTSFNGPYGAPVTVVENITTPVSFWDITGLGSNQTYYFLMKAYDAVPTPDLASSNSNHAWATTPAGGQAPSPSGELFFDANLLLPGTGQTLGISYLVPNSGNVDLVIYDISGHSIRTINGGAATGGSVTSTSWDGKDRNGNIVASGLYLIEIKAPSFHQVKKVAVVK
jgi:fibronectin type 3 domain-containing protein